MVYFIESLMSRQNILKESAHMLFISRNFGLWCFCFRVSINEKYGQWSEICVCMIHDVKCCSGLFNLQKSWSMKDALYLEDRVGSVIFGKKLELQTNQSISEFQLSRSFGEGRYRNLLWWSSNCSRGQCCWSRNRFQIWTFEELHCCYLILVVYIFPTVIIPFKFFP